MTTNQERQRECTRERSRRWRENNKEHARELERKRYAEIKTAGTYRCDPCEQSFARKGGLVRHKKTQKHLRKTEGEEPYSLMCYMIYW